MCRYKSLLRALFQTELRGYRAQSGDTQEEMAEKLRVSPRSYIDLEYGKYSLSSVTLLFFLSHLTDREIVELVRRFAERAEEDEHVRIA